jgi:hypothetical protein
MLKKFFFLFLLLLLYPANANAVEFSFGGSFKSLFIAGARLSGGDVWSDLNRLRLDFDLKLTKPVRIKIIYDNEAFIGTLLEKPEFIAFKEADAPTLFDLTETLSDRKDLFWRHLLYRIYLTYARDRLTLTVGRQRVAWGQARIWNSTDLFNPVSPFQIEGDQRIGVDAVNFEYSLGALSGLSAVYALGDDDEETSAAVRLRTNIAGYDFSIMLGEFREDNVIGFDFAGNIGDSGFRGEGVFTDPDQGGDFTRFVVSWDYNFPNTLYVLVEYLHNGGNLGEGASRGDIALFTGEIVTRNRNFIALALGYELTPLIRTDFYGILDIDGGGLFLGPALRYNVLTDLDWIIGLQFFPGDMGEYEGLPDTFYTSLEWFF